MRIIAGQFKGRVLTRFKASHIRPTTDRVKESIFSKLSDRVEGATVLDLFSGTGSLGLEALSRGAQSVCFVDKHPRSIQLAQKNARLVLKDLAMCRFVCCDALKFLRRSPRLASAVSPSSSTSPTSSASPTSSDSSTPPALFDLILIDPPFEKTSAHTIAQTNAQTSAQAKVQTNAHTILEALAQSPQIAPQAWAVIEVAQKTSLENRYGAFEQYDIKHYGDKYVAYYQKN